MKELKGAKVSIKVNGKQVYNNAPFFFEVSDDKFILKTDIGKDTVQKMEISVEKAVYVEEEKEVQEEQKEKKDESK